jgi:hypothetical protein
MTAHTHTPEPMVLRSTAHHFAVEAIKLREQNAELIAALQLMLASHDATCTGESCQITGVDLARAALARAGVTP